MENVKALIVDRDPRLQNMLLELLGGADGIAAESLNESDRTKDEDLRAKIDTFDPDVLVLGIDERQSPEMQLFESVRKSNPYLPVIVLSRLDREGAAVALAALKKGAVEYVIKSRNRTGSAQTKEHFTGRLIPIIKAVPRLNRNVLGSATDLDRAITEIERVSSDYFERPSPVDLLVIVGCLGGVPALYLLLSSLPLRIPVPVVVVQHMPKIYTEILAEDLKQSTQLDVMEASDGTEIEEGRIFIAPGGYHAVLKNEHRKNYISLNQGEKVKGFRPSMDVLLRSARKVYGKRILVAYLSGGGKDGVEGAEMIDIAGGQVILQNKSTSLLWDLPLKINIRGIDEGEYPLERMGHEISQRLNG